MVSQVKSLDKKRGRIIIPLMLVHIAKANNEKDVNVFKIIRPGRERRL